MRYCSLDQRRPKSSTKAHLDSVRPAESQPARAGARRSDALLQLQRAYGNRFVDHVLASTRSDETDVSYLGTVDGLPESGPAITREGLEDQVQDIASEPVEFSSLKDALAVGNPLDESVRRDMEFSMGRKLDGVRIHTDATSDTLCRHFQARAFTVGRDIAFSHGAYSPSTTIGRKLLAHELTHVIQQGEAPHRVDMQRMHVSSSSDPAERRSEERRVGKECRSRWSPYH